MSDSKRDILIQFRYAKENIGHAKSLIEQGGFIPMRQFRDYLKAAISSLETVDSIIKGDCGAPPNPYKIQVSRIRKPYFDAIVSGDKKEELKALSPYWIRRLIETENPKK